MASVCWFFTACGSAAPLITSVSQALTANPDGNPVSLDSVNKASASLKAFPMPLISTRKEYSGGSGSYGSTILDLRLKKSAGSGTQFGTIEGWQCKNDTHEAYFTLGVENATNGTATYTGTFKLRGTANLPYSWGNSDIVKTVSTDGTGSITAHITVKSMAVAFSGGTTNKLAGSNGYAFAWNNSGLACGKKSGGSNIAFTFSTDSSTKKKSSATASSDESLCASMPDTPTYTAPVAFGSDVSWDCLAPTGSTAVTVASASGLEDLGGTDCASNEDHYASASVDTSACGTTESVSDMSCMLNALYAMAVQSEKSVKRSLECKFEGVAQMASNGNITWDFGSGVEGSGQVHILNMTIK